mmetsp:Transcript_33847/g.52714  ORF Transcript_33847/g.52714 Transcript_33847/m.52714 type:complete len:240 (+) Transcript_33847:252-971(+)
MLTDLPSTAQLKSDIPFKMDSLITRTGQKVAERRETCWMAEDGIGSLAYSGKFMAPVPFSPSVRRIRDELFEKTNIRYDCCLINYYPDGDSACKWHTDPDHGRLWSLEEAVVSVGETRRFNLRQLTGANEDLDQYSYYVCSGDVMHMFADCQDRFEHCVLKGEGQQNCGPRISFVFKQALLQASGKRGHGAPLQSFVGAESQDAPRKFVLPANKKKQKHGSKSKSTLAKHSRKTATHKR